MWLLLIVSIAWGFSFGLIKGNLTGVDSNFVAFARMAFSLLVFLPFIKFKKIEPKLFWKLFLAGIFQFGLMYIAYIASFKYLKSYEVALFTIFTPLYVTLIDDAFNKKFNALYLITATLAIFGTWVIEKGEILSTGVITGFLLVQISNLTFAFGQLYYRKLMKTQNGLKDKDVFGVLYLGAAAVTALAAGIFTPFAALTLTGKQIWTLIYLGIFASGICFFLWNMGARRVNAGALAIFNDLKIPTAVLISLVVFGEKPNLVNLIVGGMIVVASLVVNELINRRRISAENG